MELTENSNKTIEKAVRKIRTEVRKNGIIINKVLESSMSTISEKDDDRVTLLSYRFLGTKEGITSIYECCCELKGKFIRYTTEQLERGRTWDDGDYGYIGPVGEMDYYEVGSTISINNLTQRVNDMRYDKILFIDDMQIIYQPEDYFDNRLSYVSLTWNDSEKDWDLTTDDIYRIVRDGNYLYLLLDDDTVEENHRTTPYIDICTNQIVIKRIKNTINSMKHNEDGGYVFTHYYEYKEVYKDEKLLVYSLGDKNWYYVVLDPNVIYDSISNVDISDLLFIKNSYSIKLSGEISSIEPVWYDEREEYYIDNKEHFSRNYRGVSVNCYGSYLGSSDDDEKDMYVIKYKGGKVEFFILKDSEKKITQNDEEGKTPKKLIYIGKKQPKED